MRNHGMFSYPKVTCIVAPQLDDAQTLARARRLYLQLSEHVSGLADAKARLHTINRLKRLCQDTGASDEQILTAIA